MISGGGSVNFRNLISGGRLYGPFTIDALFLFIDTSIYRTCMYFIFLFIEHVCLNGALKLIDFLLVLPETGGSLLVRRFTAGSLLVPHFTGGSLF